MKKKFFILLACFGFLGVFCARDKSPLPPGLVNRLDIIAPANLLNDETLPVVVKCADRNIDERARLHGAFRWRIEGANVPVSTINVKRGAGSQMLDLSAPGDVALALEGFSAKRIVRRFESLPRESYNGTISGVIEWDAGADRLITGDLTIPPGSQLLIQPGARIVLAEKVNIFVQGELVAAGTKEQPILFTAAEKNKPWGGFEVKNAQADFSYCFFNHGGGDNGRVFGHSNSQPVVKAENAALRLSYCFLFDNPGKAVGGQNSRVELDNCLISRCDTGGETHSCRTIITNSHILDIPNDDGVFADDDNDGFYVAEHLPGEQEPSRIESTFVITGKDDAIDHNRANLEMGNCWLEGFAHEGVAGSSGNYVYVFNTVIKNCDQGIEAGYGEPHVFVNHCVIVENDVGLRFGDSYDRGCYGHMQIQNTILHDNVDNIHNFDLLIQASRAGAIAIKYSMTNDAEYDSARGCLTGEPVFDDLYYLKENSPGAGAGNDGSDMGRIHVSLN